MNARRDVTPIVRTWLEQRGQGLPDPNAGFERFLELVDVTPQVRRRWWAPARSGASAHPARRSPSMLSATRLIAAIAIVALGTGALFFAASPTPPPDVGTSPSPTLWAPPTGWVTEEVEPGVVRVLSDGIRTISPAGEAASHDLAIGTDGSIWILTSGGQPGTLVRLGDAATPPRVPTPAPPEEEGGLRLHVAPDGAPWVHTGPVLARLCEEGWVAVRERPSATYDIAPDGTVWAASPASQPFGETMLSRLTPSGWEDVAIGVDLPEVLGGDPVSDHGGHAKGFRAAPDGSVWLGLAIRRGDDFGHVLLRFDGETWSVIDPMGVGSYFDMATFDIGADGTAWVYLDNGDLTDPHLARLSDGEWSVYTSNDGVGIIGDRGNVGGLLAVAPDGTAWMRFGYSGCDGVRSFDGSAWRQYLDGTCVGDLDIAPDGTVWVTEARGDGYSLNRRADEIFRIDPRAAGGGSTQDPWQGLVLDRGDA